MSSKLLKLEGFMEAVGYVAKNLSFNEKSFQTENL